MRKSPLILKENRVEKRTNLPRKGLEAFFATNVVELSFKRRVKPTWFKKNRKTGHLKYSRHMLCTSSWRYISSPLVRHLYKWKKPKTRRGPAWYRKRDLMIVWDILMNQFRMVSLDDYIINGYTPLTELEQTARFTAFYRINLKNLPENSKKSFSDK